MVSDLRSCTMLSTLPLFYIAQSVNSDDRRTRIQGLRVIMLLEKSVDPIRCYPIINFHMRGEQDIGMKLSTAFLLRGSFNRTNLLADVINCLLPKKHMTSLLSH